MKRSHIRVGVLMGGQSSERAISLKTGEAVCAALVRLGYRVVPIDIDANLPWRLRAQKITVAFVALHGAGGEDGSVQGLLDVLGIPYTGSGVRASAVAMDKAVTKALLHAYRIPVPPGVVLERIHRRAEMPASLALPVVVKPVAQGSTIGVTIVRTRSQWGRALRRVSRYGDMAVVESYIPGREIALSVLDGQPLPPVEVIAPGGFYDYAAKYQKAETRYRCPAPLSKTLAARLAALAARTYAVVGCAGAARVDFRITESGRPFVLEINTVPGMTERSLLPMAAAEAGMSYDMLVERILASTLDARSIRDASMGDRKRVGP